MSEVKEAAEVTALAAGKAAVVLDFGAGWCV